MSRIYNFNAGPAVLPLEVLQTAQAELIDFQNTGMSILESSHRAKAYEAIHEEAIASLRELLGISDDYAVLLLQGGASTQFSMAPMNLLLPGETADYTNSGAWAGTMDGSWRVPVACAGTVIWRRLARVLSTATKFLRTTSSPLRA